MTEPRELSSAGRHKGRLKIVLALTATYLAAEVVGGLVTGSLALLADAGHMLTDVGGLALALFGITMAERPPTPRNSFGYYRVEILAACLNALTLFGVSFYVLYEAYKRLRQPPPVEAGPMLAVALVGMVINVVGMVLLRRGSSESLNMKGAYFEVLSDLLTSIGVIVGAVVLLTTGWTYVDPIVSAAIGLFILPRTWSLLRDAVNILLEATPSDVDVEKLRGAVRALSGVEDIHDLHVWSLTSGMNSLSAHVVAARGTDASALRRRIRQHLLDNFRIHHVTLQMESPGEREPEAHR